VVKEIGGRKCVAGGCSEIGRPLNMKLLSGVGRGDIKKRGKNKGKKKLCNIQK
jgi:hypothetical protein